MISKTYANSILNMICGIKDEMSLPSYLYIGLCSDEPEETTGAITGEPTSCASYKRQIVGGSSANEKYFGTASGGSITNKKEIHFDTAKESYGLMKYFFLSSSLSGNAIMWGEINDGEGVNIDVTNGNVVPVFYAEALTASIIAPTENTTE